jgi:hypothetical protein
MKQVTNYINAVEQHIESGFNLADAMASFAPVFNKMRLDAQLEVRSNIARLISVKKKVATIEVTSGDYAGSLGFKAKHKGGTDKTEQARAMLKYYMPSKVEKASTKPTKQAKPKTKLDKLVAEFESLSKAEQAKFLRIIK